VRADEAEGRVAESLDGDLGGGAAMPAHVGGHLQPEGGDGLVDPVAPLGGFVGGVDQERVFGECGAGDTVMVGQGVVGRQDDADGFQPDGRRGDAGR
jgi:hypothetical protein